MEKVGGVVKSEKMVEAGREKRAGKGLEGGVEGTK